MLLFHLQNLDYKHTGPSTLACQRRAISFFPQTGERDATTQASFDLYLFFFLSPHSACAGRLRGGQDVLQESPAAEPGLQTLKRKSGQAGPAGTETHWRGITSREPASPSGV